MNKKPRLLEDLFKEIEEERKKYPIKIFYIDLYYFFFHKIEVLIELPKKIKRFIHRGKYGWADSDTWDLDYYLSKIIKETLLYYKKDNHGTPLGLTPKKWNDILDSIIYTFNIHQKEKEMRLTKKERIKYNRGWRLFKKYFENLWS